MLTKSSLDQRNAVSQESSSRYPARANLSLCLWLKSNLWALNEIDIAYWWCGFQDGGDLVSMFTTTIHQKRRCASNRRVLFANPVPSISAELIALLEDIGIRTESDLLFSATPLDIFSRLLDRNNLNVPWRTRIGHRLGHGAVCCSRRVGFGAVWCRRSGSSTRQETMQRQQRYWPFATAIGRSQACSDFWFWEICTIYEMRQLGLRGLHLRCLDPCFKPYLEWSSSSWRLLWISVEVARDIFHAFNTLLDATRNSWAPSRVFAILQNWVTLVSRLGLGSAVYPLRIVFQWNEITSKSPNLQIILKPFFASGSTFFYIIEFQRSKVGCIESKVDNIVANVISTGRRLMTKKNQGGPKGN